MTPLLVALLGAGEPVEPAPAAEPAPEEIRAVDPTHSFTTPEAAAAEVPAAAKTEAEPPRPVHLTGETQLRMLAIVDQDPENDRSILWRLRARFEPEGLPVDFRLALAATQRFIAEPDESGWFFQDVTLFAHATSELDMHPVGLTRPIVFDHWLGAYFPTSRASRNQDLYLAPTARTWGRYEVLPALNVGIDAWAQYRAHRYAERAGPGAPMNTQWFFDFYLVGEWVTELPRPLFGELSLGGDVRSAYERRYASRETYESEASSAAPWLQGYGWDLWVGWSPTPWLGVVLSLEHAASVLRDGIVNVNLGHRDETEAVLTFEATY